MMATMMVMMMMIVLFKVRRLCPCNKSTTRGVCACHEGVVWADDDTTEVLVLVDARLLSGTA